MYAIYAKCDFNKKDNLMRDKIVFGCNDVKLESRLIIKKNLTVEIAKEICQNHELTQKLKCSNIFNVDKIVAYKCGSCGKVENSSYHNFPAKSVECFNCKKRGHLARWCRSRKQKFIKGYIYLELGNQKLRFQVDTGSDIFLAQLPKVVAPIVSKIEASTNACRRVRAPEPTDVPNELATSLAPILMDNTNARQRDATSKMIDCVLNPLYNTAEVVITNERVVGFTDEESNFNFIIPN
ncbi:hypothetical protein A3Q56_00048 [Intoshia linei]|uniref:CCHC-type domain-containing protein n=1 Tax=Intoshia linei TaxID=1819745 RepID=A0A177BCZ4_9BILA|nr:hypothetical protein A3Q56_00048 [Intoshia linei]